VTLALTIALSWALGGLMHFWPRLPPLWRWVVSIATSAGGVTFLVAALAAEGSREGETRALVVLGPSFLTETSSASESLHYYVLTAVCLLLGFMGLVLGDPLSQWLRRRWVRSAVSVAWLVTTIRFLLEKSAAPTILTEGVGITWMAPVAGVLFAVCLRSEGRPLRDVLRPVIRYGYAVRAFVAFVGVMATRWHLGSHYDVSAVTSVTPGLTGAEYTFVSGSWSQVAWLTLLPQLVVLPLFTMATTLAGCLLAWRLVPATTLRRSDLSATAGAGAPSRGGR